MVNPVGGGPQQAVIQTPNAALAQDVRQRNEQTQPRQAPAADTQHNTLQTRGDDQQRKQNQLAPQRRQPGSKAAEESGSGPRGQLIDIRA